MRAQRLSGLMGAMDEPAVVAQLRRLVNAVAAGYDVSVPELIGAKRTSELATAKYLAFCLCWSVAGLEPEKMCRSFDVTMSYAMQCRLRLATRLQASPAHRLRATAICAGLGLPVPASDLGLWPQDKVTAVCRVTAELAPVRVGWEALISVRADHRLTPWCDLAVDVICRFPEVQRKQAATELGMSHSSIAVRSARLPGWLQQDAALRAADRWLSFLSQVPFRKESRRSWR